MKSLAEIHRALSQPQSRPDFDVLLLDIRAHKAHAVAAGDEAEAKRVWCLEHSAETQQLYQQAVAEIKSAHFYEGWCSLEQVELALNRLRPHGVENWTRFRLDFIDEKVVAVQSLYPYKLFISPEIIELEKQCNICGRVISIREPCGHKVGEIYNGEYCCRIVTKCEFIATAFVALPVQKYSVPFLADPKTGKSRDQYNYSTVEYLADRWPSPYHDWRATWTKALHPKERFGVLRRNDKCPCESGKKYKACCLRRSGILRPHVQFEFRYPLPMHLQTIEFSE